LSSLRAQEAAAAATAAGDNLWLIVLDSARSRQWITKSLKIKGTIPLFLSLILTGCPADPMFLL
jgi:hypothetical protein